MRYEVFLREVNQTDGSRTTNVNGNRKREGLRGVRVWGKGFSHFVPWSNVAYIRENR